MQIHTLRFLVVISFAVFALASLGAVPAHAGGAADRIQNFSDNMLPILQDPAYSDGSQESYTAQRAQLLTLIDDLFDWLTISQLTVSRAWNDFSPDQQREFVEAFRYLLEATYMDRIQQSGTQRVEAIDETEISNGKFEVTTLVVVASPDRELPITYRLYHHGVWKVYDVVVEGVSLVGNYRSQFQELLDSHTPEEFIDIVQQKAEEMKSAQNQ
ncbi:MAG: ABC transporter substrate-binding protein [Desulfovibrio sp.]|nr:MAG: ABC transporter substrate-binding protein [Desulfovibrio sp.]